MFLWIIFGLPLLLLLLGVIAINLLVIFGEYFDEHEDSYVQKLKREGKW